MYAMTVGVDLAKTRFEVAIADEHYQIQKRLRLTRPRFEQFIANHPQSLFVMETCGTAQHFGRRLEALGHTVKLLPAQYVKAYVKRNKTDSADAAALIEASRCADIRPVPIKTAEQQQLQLLHRLREQYKHTRTTRINLLRGSLREFGIAVPKGVTRGLTAVREALELADNGLPDALRPWVFEVLQEMTTLKEQMSRLEQQIQTLTQASVRVQRWMEVPGIGLLGATALHAALVDPQRFPSGRHLASWVGITPREYSSGEHRRLGRISKRGDAYLRMLLIHGARSALLAARRAEKAGRPLDPLRRWALQTENRVGTNKATVALANKIVRILWAIAKHDRRYDTNWRSQHATV